MRRFASLCVSGCRSLDVVALVLRFDPFLTHGVHCTWMRWNQRTDTYSDARHQQNCCERKMGGSGTLGGFLVYVPRGTHAHKDYADVRDGFSKRRRAIPCFAGRVSTPFHIKRPTCGPDGGSDGGGGGVGSHMQRLLVISLSYLSFYSSSSTCLLSGQWRTLPHTRSHTSGQANGVVEGTRLSFATSSTCGGAYRHNTHVRTAGSLQDFNITT